MQRPISIVWFERCYLGSLAVSLLNMAVQWPGLIAKMSVQMESNPAAAQLGSSFIPAALGIGAVLVIAVSLVLWYFTARQRSAVTKWIVTVLFGYNLLMFLLGLSSGTVPTGFGAVLGVAALVLNGLAVWQLFKPDTKAWFGEVAA
ncbi:hypothetical protein U1872_01205 [Sphingomonas sp. RB3P16]|uniref:hypothetical protein n=1 Tax=Parasphingomonas frigoris TaxID=3096163 RepID=UPI002FC5DB03